MNDDSGMGTTSPQGRRIDAVDRNAMLPVGDLKRVVSSPSIGSRGRVVILHEIGEPMPGDPPDLAERRLRLRAAVVVQPRTKPAAMLAFWFSRAQITNGKPNRSWYFALAW